MSSSRAATQYGKNNNKTTINMKKKLLKITHVEDEICEVDVNLETEEDAMLLSSALYGIMQRSPRATRAIVAAASTYMKERMEKREPQTKKNTKAS